MLYQILTRAEIKHTVITEGRPEPMGQRWCAMIIIFEYVIIKERDPICNVVHIIDANWRMNIILGR